MTWTVYKIKDAAGRGYIGVTQKTAQARWRQHINAAKRVGHEMNYPLSVAIRNAGEETFSLEIITECYSAKEAAVCERAQIAQHGTFAPAQRGFNQTLGGEGTLGIVRPILLGTTAERLRDKSMPEPNTGCFLWLSAMTKEGYGVISLPGAKGKYAHRVAYEEAYGAINSGEWVRHKCGTPSCINPAHLEATTLRENRCRGKSPVGVNAAKTHCIHGHPLSGDNLRMVTNGTRHPIRGCRTCIRARDTLSAFRQAFLARAAKNGESHGP